MPKCDKRGRCAVYVIEFLYDSNTTQRNPVKTYYNFINLKKVP